MPLRLLVTQNQHPTQNEVSDYMNSTGLNCDESYAALINSVGPTLQVQQEDLTWIDVTTVTEIRDVPVIA